MVCPGTGGPVAVTVEGKHANTQHGVNLGTTSRLWRRGTCLLKVYEVLLCAQVLCGGCEVGIPVRLDSLHGIEAQDGIACGDGGE